MSFTSVKDPEQQLKKFEICFIIILGIYKWGLICVHSNNSGPSYKIQEEYKSKIEQENTNVIGPLHKCKKALLLLGIYV